MSFFYAINVVDEITILDIGLSKSLAKQDEEAQIEGNTGYTDTHNIFFRAYFLNITIINAYLVFINRKSSQNTTQEQMNWSGDSHFFESLAHFVPLNFQMKTSNTLQWSALEIYN